MREMHEIGEEQCRIEHDEYCFDNMNSKSTMTHRFRRFTSRMFDAMLSPYSTSLQIW